MTRFALFGAAVLALCGFATADDKKDVPKELVPFQGTWKLVKVSLGGMDLPADKKDTVLKFEGDKVTPIEDGKAKETATFKIDAKKEPPTIDIDDPKGKEAMSGIYKFDKDGKLTLTVGFGKGARPKGFDDKESLTLILEKVKK